MAKKSTQPARKNGEQPAETEIEALWAAAYMLCRVATDGDGPMIHRVHDEDRAEARRHVEEAAGYVSTAAQLLDMARTLVNRREP